MAVPVLPPTSENVDLAARLLAAGGLVAMPTETVYGLAASARAERAVARIFELKGRPRNHPLIVHLGSGADVGAWADGSGTDGERRRLEALAAAFWPGPLTLVVRKAAWVTDALTGGQPTVALRVPGHPVALALLDAFGGAVAAPSAYILLLTPSTPRACHSYSPSASANAALVVSPTLVHPPVHAPLIVAS